MPSRRGFLAGGLAAVAALMAVPVSGVAQLVARRTHNPEVAGSSPAPAMFADLDAEAKDIFDPSPLAELHADEDIAQLQRDAEQRLTRWMYDMRTARRPGTWTL